MADDGVYGVDLRAFVKYLVPDLGWFGLAEGGMLSQSFSNVELYCKLLHPESRSAL
jgi:hypothetical protein